MTTATETEEIQYVDDEELPAPQSEEEEAFSYIGVIRKMGFVVTPQWYIDDKKHFNPDLDDSDLPNRLFVLGIDPVGWRYDTNPDWWKASRIGNHEDCVWVEYKTADGKRKRRNSQFGDIIAGFAALGYVIESSADCAALVGKQFRFRRLPKKYGRNQVKPTFVPIPVEEAPDYKFSGEQKVLRRGYDRPQTAEEKMADSESTKAVDVLDGLTPSEFTMALAQAGLKGLVMEAVEDDGAKLITRLEREGKMKFEDGRLQKVTASA